MLLARSKEAVHLKSQHTRRWSTCVGSPGEQCPTGRHVVGCRLARETWVQSALDDMAIASACTYRSGCARRAALVKRPPFVHAVERAATDAEALQSICWMSCSASAMVQGVWRRVPMSLTVSPLSCTQGQRVTVQDRVTARRRSFPRVLPASQWGWGQLYLCPLPRHRHRARQ